MDDILINIIYFLGLLLSSMVKTSERAMTILPLILLPQIMLAGIISKISSGVVEFISYFTLSRWGVEGFHIIQQNITGKVFEKGNNNSILPKLVNGKIDAVDNLLNQFHPSYRNKEIFNSLTASIKLDSLAILAMVILMILLIF